MYIPDPDIQALIRVLYFHKFNPKAFYSPLTFSIYPEPNKKGNKTHRENDHNQVKKNYQFIKLINTA